MDLVRNTLQQNIDQVYSTGKILSDILTKFCRIGQYCLICLFFILLTSLTYLYLDSLSRLQKSQFWMIIWLIGSLWILFNILFNYSMCVFVKPGSPQYLPSHLLSHIQQKCRRCGVIKPPRTHHCSMCNSCILQMDHHCPWIGQCVGHHNRSYFMNFLTYTQIGIILLFRIISDYMNSQIYEKDIQRQGSQGFMFEIYVFITTLIVVLGLFNLFHWHLIFSGKTTLQCCLSDSRYTPTKNWLFNASLVFGTKNIFLMIMPKFTVLRHKGINWYGQQLNQSNTSMIQVQHNNIGNTQRQIKNPQ